MKFSSVFAAAIAAQLASAEKVCLVNSSRGGEISSGIAYYADGNAEPNLPNDYTDVTHGSNIAWEGQTVRGTFGTGVTFTANIDSDAAGKSMNLPVGTGSNGFKNFQCYKTTNPGANPYKLYEVDGWVVFSIYWCIPR